MSDSTAPAGPAPAKKALSSFFSKGKKAAAPGAGGAGGGGGGAAPKLDLPEYRSLLGDGASSGWVTEAPAGEEAPAQLERLSATRGLGGGARIKMHVSG